MGQRLAKSTLYLKRLLSTLKVFFDDFINFGMSCNPYFFRRGLDRSQSQFDLYPRNQARPEGPAIYLVPHLQIFAYAQ